MLFKDIIPAQTMLITSVILYIIKEKFYKINNCSNMSNSNSEIYMGKQI